MTSPIKTELPRNNVALPDPTVLDLEIGIRWIVVLKGKAEGKLSKPVYYCVDTQSYESMARNNADILRWIKEARWRLEYYKNQGAAK